MTKKEFEEFYNIAIKRCRELLLSKGSDYADNTDVFGNFKRMSKNVKDVLGTEMSAEQVAQMQILHKLDRLQNLSNQGKAPNNESVFDSYVDLVNYALLAWGLRYENNKE